MFPEGKAPITFERGFIAQGDFPLTGKVKETDCGKSGLGPTCQGKVLG